MGMLCMSIPDVVVLLTVFVTGVQGVEGGAQLPRCIQVGRAARTRLQWHEHLHHQVCSSHYRRLMVGVCVHRPPHRGMEPWSIDVPHTDAEATLPADKVRSTSTS